MEHDHRHSGFLGRKLEDFIKFDLQIVVNIEHKNPALFIKEMDSWLVQPTVLEKWQFDKIVELFEPYRCEVEQCLDKFNEEEDTWINYTKYNLVYIPIEVYEAVHRLLLNNFLR